MDVYGIIGDPVEHALSPVIHQKAFDVLDLDAVFHRFSVRTGDVREAVEGASALGIEGLTVTMPHKESVAELPFLETEDVAEQIGVVNTVDLANRRGYNTDGVGVVRALAENDVSIRGKRILLLGAGGAGKAIAYELACRDARVDIANIELPPAEAIVDVIRDSGGRATAKSLDEIPKLLPAADILINATSVGMNEDASLVSPRDLHEDLVVFDIVHTPIETRLLRDAAAVGSRTIDGASVLLFQGVKAFELWTGLDAPVDAMEEALRVHIAERDQGR